MDLAPRKRRNEDVTEWVTGGSDAATSDVEPVVFDDRPGASYLTPETVRFLERLEARAEAGNAEDLHRPGTIFGRCGAASVPADRMPTNNRESGASRP